MTRMSIVLIVLLAAVCLAPAGARCQVHAQLGPAAILGQDVRLGVFGLAGDDQIGALADSRFLLTAGLDLGIQAGLRRLTGADVEETVFDGGVDLRYGLFEGSEGPGFDMSAGGGFGFTANDDRTILTAVAQSSASRTLITARGREVTPYAGLALAVSTVKIDDPNRKDEFDDPDLDVMLRLGLATGLSTTTTLTGELQIKEDPAFYLGLSTSF